MKRVNILDVIISNFENITNYNQAKIFYHLGTSKYKWRNKNKLALKTLINIYNIDDVINTMDQYIIKSKSKSKKIIYRLKDDIKERFDNIYKQYTNITEIKQIDLKKVLIKKVIELDNSKLLELAKFIDQLKN